MRGLLRNVVVALVAVSAIAVLATWGLYRAARQEPDFYQAALQVESTIQKVAGDALEREILDLHNEAREEGRWEAVFTNQQLNGWLASDLTENFPNLLPPGTKDPWVAIRAGQAQIACRHQSGSLETVISFALGVQLTEDTNTLAIRVSKLRAGTLPLPLKRFLDGISRAAKNADLRLRWTSMDGDPLALVTVPSQHEDYAHRAIYLETIELRDGEIYLSGRTEESGTEMLAQHAPLTSGEKNTDQR